MAMKVSLKGLFSGVELSLRSSEEEYPCLHAFSMMELGDNLRHLARGDCTVEEFFELYSTDTEDNGSWANEVDKRKYKSMQDEEAYAIED